MAMTTYCVGISEDLFRELSKDEEKAEEYFGNESGEAEIMLQNAQTLNYLLSGDAWDNESPAGAAILGADEWMMFSESEAQINTSGSLAAIVKALKQPENKDKIGSWDPDDADDPDELEPHYMEITKEELLQSLQTLTKFYEKCLEKKLVVVCYAG